MTKYKNLYRVESTRLKCWDYSTPWWYYVTINTKGNAEQFGEIKNGEMILNELGGIVKDTWEQTTEIRKNVELDEYIIMPNHIHGIIIINGNEVETHRVRLKEEIGDAFDASVRIVKNHLGDIIRGFKSAVTRQARETGCGEFAWHSRFYDRIIRDENELYNIRKYMNENPLRWEIKTATLRRYA